MVDPNTVHAPRDRIVGPVEVFFTSADRGWSLCRLLWKDSADDPDEAAQVAIGFRWNGHADDPAHRGFPRGNYAKPVWCVLPDEISKPLVALMEMARAGGHFLGSPATAGG